MQELFLFGQIGDERHDQLLSILAGLTASKPRAELQRHVILRPARVPLNDVVPGGGSQALAPKPGATVNTAAKESFHVRLVKTVKAADFGGKTEPEEVKSGWVQRFYDTPEPGTRSAGLRNVRDIGIQGNDPIEALRGSGYM
jgi:Med18 protein